MPRCVGTPIGSTRPTNRRAQSCLSTPTRTSAPRTSSGVMVTRRSSGTTRSITTRRTSKCSPATNYLLQLCDIRKDGGTGRALYIKRAQASGRRRSINLICFLCEAYCCYCFTYPVATAALLRAVMLRGISSAITPYLTKTSPA